MPLISIIVPCYNQSQYLDECLQSVLHQTFTDWECIIVNDGSPDNTEEVAAKWVEKDARFHYYKKENGGVASARNFGIEKATGEWILPLDGDDKIGKQYLELASKEFKNNPKIVYCKANLFGKINVKWNLSNYSYEEMLVRNHIFCSAFFKKEQWYAVNGYDTTFIYGLEDWDFWLSILTPNSKVIRIDYIGFYYRKKDISREVLLNESEYKTLISESNIYKKHIDKYLDLDKNPIKNYILNKKNHMKLKHIRKEINKNIFTRFLFKIIEKL